MLSSCNLEQNMSNKVKENKQNWTRAETFDICFGITFGHCYKGDTYGKQVSNKTWYWPNIS